jgi:crooked neck
LIQELEETPYDYDCWFDYIRLEEQGGRQEKIREVFERAVAQLPLVKEKRYWRRYVYLWIWYSVWEEVEANDRERAQKVLETALTLIPHQNFTFSKVWNLLARLYIRNHNVNGARKLFGRALGLNPKLKTYKLYIEMELGLREFDRARKIYELMLSKFPSDCSSWISYAELENSLEDFDRCRGIYELAVNQPLLDLPELLWKSYIDFELQQEEFANARQLYERLWERAGHVKVAIAWSEFEYIAGDNSDKLDAARKRYLWAHDEFRTQGDNTSRTLLLESWQRFEKVHGDAEGKSKVDKMLPKKVKKRRKLEDGSGWEEYWDYVFEGEDVGQAGLLAMAHRWKAENIGSDSSSEESDEEE